MLVFCLRDDIERGIEHDAAEVEDHRSNHPSASRNLMSSTSSSSSRII